MAKQTKVHKGTEAYDISIEDVLASGLIPDAPEINVSFIGKNWFKENIGGVAYHFIKNEDGTLTVKETRQSIAKKPTAPKKASAPPKPAFTTIKCIDCGTLREVHVQDAFQVKRCVDCQKKFRNAKRLARLKEKRAEVRAAAGK